jgi:hypothetical protein
VLLPLGRLADVDDERIAGVELGGDILDGQVGHPPLGLGDQLGRRLGD